MASDDSAHAPKGRHSRGYLPHRDLAARAQAVTFRLHDSLPHEVLEGAIQGLAPEDDERRRRLHALLDNGLGSCVLRQAEMAQAVVETLLAKHGADYRLYAFAVMPNHVHALLRPRADLSLSVVMKAWKSVSSRRIQGGGRLWAPDYFDRMVRDADHFDQARAYIHLNPVRAGLAQQAEDWPWSSKHPQWVERLAWTPEMADRLRTHD